MTDRELMQMALEALGLFASDESDDGQMAIAAYVALRDRLAQPNTTQVTTEVTTEVTEEVFCKTHPDAPHGFDRNASLSEDRYVCECESWEPNPSKGQQMSKKCRAYSESKLGLEPADNRKSFYAGWEAAIKYVLTSDNSDIRFRAWAALRDRLAQPDCPPCTQNCEQGRKCPYHEGGGEDEKKTISHRTTYKYV